MKAFMDKDFLLQTDTARRLYHDYAETMPIIDYHCHISPQEIAENQQYNNITEVWLGGDHYKWRAMRSCGVEERCITGDASPEEKFRQWAHTLPRCIGNPLYHWTYMELKKYFGITEFLDETSADRIYAQCNERLQQPDMRVRGIIEQSGVKLICTTDDPSDDLRWHKILRNDATFSVKVLPAFRPDKAMNVEKEGFASYIETLGRAADVSIQRFADLCRALERRIDFFQSMGCRVSDHALDAPLYEEATEAELDAVLAKGLAGEPISQREADAFRTAVLLFLSRQYHQRGWVMQLHFGCIRNNNSRRFRELGPDTGFDAANNSSGARQLARLLDAMEAQNALPRTVLYSLNQYDNEIILTLAGCFQSAEVPGKIQLGSAWWFNDTKTGMEKQLTDFGNLSVLGGFIGMLTDSRSFLSYTRHDYFRRILCNHIGRLVENGEYHNRLEYLGQMVQDISYNNTVRYFGFDVEKPLK